MSNENVVQPDLLFVTKERSATVTEDNIRGAPDLIVEIVSETTRKRDELTKRKLYERYGVREYWIVDPELETVRIFKRKDQVYAPPVGVDPGENCYAEDRSSSRIPTIPWRAFPIGDSGFRTPFYWFTDK